MARMSARQLVLIGVLLVVVFLVGFGPKLQTREMEEALGERERDAVTTPGLVKPTPTIAQGHEGETASFGWQSATLVRGQDPATTSDDMGLGVYSYTEKHSDKKDMRGAEFVSPATEEQEDSILDNYWMSTYSSLGEELLLSSSLVEGLRESLRYGLGLISGYGDRSNAVEEDARGGGGTVLFDWSSSDDANATYDVYGEGWLSTSGEEVFGGTLHFSEWQELGSWEMGPIGSLYNSLLNMLELLLPTERHPPAENTPSGQTTSSAAPAQQGDVLPFADPSPVGTIWNGGGQYYEYLLQLLQASIERRGAVSGSGGIEDDHLSQIYNQVLEELAKDVGDSVSADRSNGELN